MPARKPHSIPRPAPLEVFISHASSDRRFVSNLVSQLAEVGIRCWYSRHAIQAAQNWHDEIGLALARCDWFALVLSPSAVKSKWVKRERLYALRNDRYEDRIIPIIIRSCDSGQLSWTLDSFQSVDFRRGHDSGLKSLLRIWGCKPASS